MGKSVPRTLEPAMQTPPVTSSAEQLVFPKWDTMDASAMICIMRIRGNYDWPTIASFWNKSAQEAEARYNSLNEKYPPSLKDAQGRSWWDVVWAYAPAAEYFMKREQMNRVNGKEFALAGGVKAEPKAKKKGSFANTILSAVRNRTSDSNMPAGKDTPVVKGAAVPPSTYRPRPRPRTTNTASSTLEQPMIPEPSSIMKKAATATKTTETKTRAKNSKAKTGVKFNNTVSRLATIVDVPPLDPRRRVSITDFRALGQKQNSPTAVPIPTAPPLRTLRPVRSQERLATVKPHRPVKIEKVADTTLLKPAPPAKASREAKLDQKRRERAMVVDLDEGRLRDNSDRPGEANGRDPYCELPGVEWGEAADYPPQKRLPGVYGYYEMSRGKAGNEIERGLGVVQ